MSLRENVSPWVCQKCVTKGTSPVVHILNYILLRLTADEILYSFHSSTEMNIAGTYVKASLTGFTRLCCSMQLNGIIKSDQILDISL